MNRRQFLAGVSALALTAGVGVGGQPILFAASRLGKSGIPDDVLVRFRFVPTQSRLGSTWYALQWDVCDDHWRDVMPADIVWDDEIKIEPTIQIAGDGQA